MKSINFQTELLRDVVLGIMSSNLFMLIYTIWGSCQVVNSIDFKFPVNIKDLSNQYGNQIQELTHDLIKDSHDKSEIQLRHYSSRGPNFTMEKQYFYLKKSKKIIDRIDEYLAMYFNFSVFELDYIRNYDIKYRMGDDLYKNNKEVDD